jgi:hypothetical protein
MPGLDWFTAEAQLRGLEIYLSFHPDEKSDYAEELAELEKECEGLSQWDLADIRDEEQYATEYYKRLQAEEDAFVDYVEKNRKWKWRA